MATTSRTRRGEGYASQGAVRQQGGTLPVYVCNTCHHEVVWAESRRTGRKYLVNVKRGYLDQRFYIGSDLHSSEDCQRRVAEREEFEAEHERQRRNREMADRMKQAQRQFRAGEITEDEYVALLDAME